MTPAEQNLRSHQRQLDADGSMVGVSRQALDEVFVEIERLRAERRGTDKLVADLAALIPLKDTLTATKTHADFVAYFRKALEPK